MEQRALTEAEQSAHKDISRCLEQAEVRLLHDNPTEEEVEDAGILILKSLSLMNVEHNKLFK